MTIRDTLIRHAWRAFTTAAFAPALLATLTRPDLRPGLAGRFFPRPVRREGEPGTRVWIHAASAGEVRLAALLCRSLRAALAGAEISLTTNTDSGYRVAQGEDFDVVRRFPFDVYPALRRLFSLLAPDVIVLMEMELWPGLIALARERGIPVVVVNARMGEERVADYRRLGGLFPDLLAHPVYLTRDDSDLERLHRVGVALERLMVTGDMKIDQASRGLERRGPLRRDGRAPVLLGVSTHEGEEAVLLEALRHLRESYPGARLILAPRHARRVGEVLDLVAASGFRGLPVGETPAADLSGADVWVEDRFGRMDRLYPLATAAFVGGSLVDAGGHNVLEPVMHGLPVLCGPHTANWRNWVFFLDECGALSIVKTSYDIARILGIVVEESGEVTRIMVSVKARLDQQKGAASRNARIVRTVLTGGDPFALRD